MSGQAPTKYQICKKKDTEHRNQVASLILSTVPQITDSDGNQVNEEWCLKKLVEVFENSFVTQPNVRLKAIKQIREIVAPKEDDGGRGGADKRFYRELMTELVVRIPKPPDKETDNVVTVDCEQLN